MVPWRQKGPVPDLIAARRQGHEAPLLVDVRAPEEVKNESYIEGAHFLPQERPLILLCCSGTRSRLACQALAAAGYDQLANLAGGLQGWQQAGFPVVS